jgi:acyl-CoA synthetase (AMP-forming)/AMP-acid ligase II
MAFSSIIEALVVRADRTPEKMAYAADDEEVSYRQLLVEAQEIAGCLSAFGVSHRDRCAIVLGGALDFIRAIYAIQLVGAAPVAINGSLPARTVMQRANMVKSKLVICDDDLFGVLDAASKEHNGTTAIRPWRDIQVAATGKSFTVSLPSGDEVSHLQITSGTTGDSKAAILLHRNVMACCDSYLRLVAPKPDDVAVNWLPLYHDLGLVRFIYLPLFAPYPVHFIPPAIANLGRWLQTIDRCKGTITAGPDFAYRIVSRTIDPTGVDISSLRYVINGGEPVRKSTIEMFENRFGLPGIVRPGYGLAEATLGVSSLKPGEKLRSDSTGNVSCGQALPGLEINIVDEDGNLLPDQRPGRILIRGEQVFAGYFEDKTATDAVLQNGWLDTGDVGYLDDERYLYILGRSRAMIKRAGAMISPREVEESVDRINGVRFSAAIGLTLSVQGSTEEVVVVAEVHPKDALSEGEMQSLARSISAKVVAAIGNAPGEIILVTPKSIPRTQNGKIRYQELRRLVTDGVLAQCGKILFGGDRIV